MSVADLVPRVVEALGVSDSYAASTVPAGIRRCINRLLRDYNFPKSLKKETFENLLLGDSEFELPDGFKKEHLVMLHTPASIGTIDAWTEPLRKREGMVLPSRDGVARFYWLYGTKLAIDTPISDIYAGINLQLWYQSMDPATNEDWFSTDFSDVLFTYSVYRLAPEMRKPEVQQAFAPMWQEDATSIAIYANELEFSNLDMVWREARQPDPERYPA